MMKKEPAYLRPKLIPLDPIHCNKVLPFPTLPQKNSSISLYVNHGNYYGYNTESIKDFGWGCAWRCIQMALCHQLISAKSEQIMPTLEQMFLEFGQKDVLITLYQALHQIAEVPSYLKDRNFAPHELDSGWAEPFIGQLVLFRYGFKHELICVNGIPEDAYAPAEAFQRVISFPGLVSLLKLHFSTGTKMPVMMDDASYAYCVIGIGETEEFTFLWIADPHIGKSESNDVGIYWVGLDKEGGKVMSSVGPEQREKMYQHGCDGTIYFSENKKWMILI